MMVYVCRADLYIIISLSESGVFNYRIVVVVVDIVALVLFVIVLAKSTKLLNANLLQSQ